MAEKVGFGKHTYEWIEGWGQLPDGWPPLGQVAMVTDSERPGLRLQPQRTTLSWFSTGTATSSRHGARDT